MGKSGGKQGSGLCKLKKLISKCANSLRLTANGLRSSVLAMGDSRLRASRDRYRKVAQGESDCTYISLPLTNSRLRELRTFTSISSLGSHRRAFTHLMSFSIPAVGYRGSCSPSSTRGVVQNPRVP